MADWRQQTVDTYNKSAKEMAEYFRGIGSRVSDIDRAFELAGSPEEAKVIEIGCGDGRDAKEIIKKTSRYIGFDISKGLIELARTHVPNASFEVADAMQYAFPRDTDIVFAFASLLHLDKDEVKKLMQTVHAGLKSKGILYISLKLAPTYTEKAKEDKYGKRMFYFYNPPLIEELMGPGYTIVYQDSQSMGDTDWFTVALRKT